MDRKKVLSLIPTNTSDDEPERIETAKRSISASLSRKNSSAIRVCWNCFRVFISLALLSEIYLNGRATEESLTITSGFRRCPILKGNKVALSVPFTHIDLKSEIWAIPIFSDTLRRPSCRYSRMRPTNTHYRGSR